MVLNKEFDESNDITLEINKFGAIANAKININKINIIGGKNSTGKSTSSKLLYSFLKANSEDKKELAVEKLSGNLKTLASDLRSFLGYQEVKRSQADVYRNKIRTLRSKIENSDFDDSVDKFDELKRIYEDSLIDLDLDKLLNNSNSSDIDDLAKSKNDLLKEKEELVNSLESIELSEEDIIKAKESANGELNSIKEMIQTISSLGDGAADDTDKFLDKLNKDKQSINLRLEALDKLLTSSSELNNKLNDLENKIEQIDLKIKPDKKTTELLNINNRFIELEEFTKKVDGTSEDFFEEAIRSLLDTEFDIDRPTGYDMATLYGNYSGSKFGCDINFNDFTFKTQGSFNIKKVIYIDSFSIFDFRSYFGDGKGLLNSNHVASLQKMLFETYSAYQMFDSDDPEYDKLNYIMKKIDEIIGGKIVQEEGALIFKSDDGFSTYMKNTASGVKQIATLQTLISKKLLKSGSFLILDEPEVNMHPEWQLKIAQVLIVIAMSLNVNLYINTHSPLFIRIFESLTKFYGINDDVNYYLTTPSESEYKGYNFVNVKSDNLEIIYDDLGEPYRFLEYVDVETKLKNKK